MPGARIVELHACGLANCGVLMALNNLARNINHYLQKYVKGTIHWLNSGARFRTTAEREEALRHAEQARRFYANLAE